MLEDSRPEFVVCHQQVGPHSHSQLCTQPYSMTKFEFRLVDLSVYSSSRHDQVLIVSVASIWCLDPNPLTYLAFHKAPQEVSTI